MKLVKFSAKLVANFRRSLEGDFRAVFFLCWGRSSEAFCTKTPPQLSPSNFTTRFWVVAGPIFSIAARGAERKGQNPTQGSRGFGAPQGPWNSISRFSNSGSRTPPLRRPLEFVFRFSLLLGVFFLDLPRILGVPRREQPLLFFGDSLFFFLQNSKDWRVRVFNGAGKKGGLSEAPKRSRFPG